MSNGSTESIVIVVVAILFLFSLMGYCCIKAACARRASSNLNTIEDTSVWTLPPAYSDLSQHLPPSYSQACHVIDYTRSEDNIVDGQTNPGFEIQPNDTDSYSSSITEFSSVQNEDTAPENTAQNEGTLPPTYSNLSLRQLPPSYSQACIVADRQSLDSTIDIDRRSLGSISEEEIVL
ncbi:unnamed protein product [Mytilus edulis]|uniref:Uncharacterized protein n=1 Tax=Mytilus edulis TaxID=6550 RepID=A0A8S3R4Q0_MYTED|nr:unnamed protein product [Mytilus edulis]